MQYTVVHFSSSFDEQWMQDLFEQNLCDFGFEVFDGADAYIQTSMLEQHEEQLQSVVSSTEGVVLLGIDACEDANWNEAWESEHVVEELAMGVRIVPHCAFGAGHHETTSMMVDALVESHLTAQMPPQANVLDMGCGTGVLGIVAKKCGAASVVAVDIDDKSVANTLENAASNGVELDVRLGSSVPDGTYDLILANIHRNILIEMMPDFAKHLKTHGEVWMSGFYEQDVPTLVEAAQQAGLTCIQTRGKGEWRMMKVKTEN